MTKKEQWEANKKFLNRTIKRGDKIILSDTPNNATGFFKQELDYLKEGETRNFKL